MTIALNLGSLGGGLGSAAVGRSILAELAHDSRGHAFVAWVPSRWKDDLPDVDHISFRFTHPSLMGKVHTDQVGIRAALLSGRVTTLFSLNDTSLVASPAPHLLLLHQPNLVAPPRHLDFATSPRYRARLRLMRAYFRQCLKTVSIMTVQTEYMRDGLVEQWGYPADRIRIVPSAISCAEETVGTWRPSGSGRPYVLYPASAAPHKNHIVLAEMMAETGKRGHVVDCVVTVEAGEVAELVSRAASAGVLDRFVFAGRMSQGHVRECLAGAAATVLPSKLESFGLPYYEAMAVGCPVVAADRPFAREACGPAARYCDPNCGASFGHALADLLEDPTAADAQSREGMARYARTARTWSEIASEYVHIVEELSSRH